MNRLTQFLAGPLALAMMPALVAAEIGVATDVRGGAMLWRDQAESAMETGGIVKMYDEIETDASGTVAVSFVDATKLDIEENSLVVVDEFIFDPANADGKVTIQALAGSIHYLSGKIAKANPENIRIASPTAVIAVRGTEFTLSVDEIGRSSVVLLPTCTGPDSCVTGAIEVLTDAGSVLLNQAYQATFVDTSTTLPTAALVIEPLGPRISGADLLLLGPRPQPQTLSVTEVEQAEFSALNVDLLANRLSDDPFADDPLADDPLSVDLLSTEAMFEDPMAAMAREFEASLNADFEEESTAAASEAASTLAEAAENTKIKETETGSQQLSSSGSDGAVGLNLSGNDTPTINMETSSGAASAAGAGGSVITIVQAN